MELEPRLADIEAEVADVADDGDRFCANLVWYGEVKSKMSRLVGWSRRADEWRTPIIPGRLYNGSELIGLYQADEPAKVAAQAEDIANGRSVLWSSTAYNVAYDHLYELLPDCRRCGCWGVAS